MESSLHCGLVGCPPATVGQPSPTNSTEGSCILGVPETHTVRTFARRASVALLLVGSNLCFAQSTDLVACWGRNDESQCLLPDVPGPWSQVAGGKLHSVALNANGSITCWGSNDFGQCSVPAISSTYSFVAAGWYHTLAITSTGSAVAWGRNDSGQCDISPTLGTCTQLSGGAGHSLALRINGEVIGWGSNTFGQIAVPPSLGPCTAVAAGGFHSVVLTVQGVVVCWGRNESAITGSSKAGDFLRDVRDGIDSVDILLCGDSNTGFTSSSLLPMAGWTDGMAGALVERGFPQYATPLLPVQPVGTSFGVATGQWPMPFGSGSSSGSTQAFNVSGLASAPPELIARLTSGGGGLRPNGAAFDFSWIPAQPFGFTNEVSGVYIYPESALDIKRELVYRVLRGELPESNSPGSYFQAWRNTISQHLVNPTLRLVSGSTHGWVADELVLPADENRANATLHANCCGSGFGQAFAVAGNCALGLQSVYKRTRGWGVQPLNYHGGATMTQIASDVTQMPLESRMTWLKELVERQVAGGGSGRMIVVIQGGINQDLNVPDSWGVAVTSIQHALESAWSALGMNLDKLTFVAMVSHPISESDDELLSLRQYANGLPESVENLTIVDLSKLTTSSEMAVRQWYFDDDRLHLRGQGYLKLSGRILDSLMGQSAPCSPPAECQQLGSCTQVAAGSFTTAALKANGTIRCWGSPIGGAMERPIGSAPYTELAAGHTHFMARMQSTITCWGSNEHGQSNVPLNIGPVRHVAAGGFHSIAIAEPLPPSSCLGDWNNDGAITGIDLSVILAGWGTPAADLNLDGTTDGVDIAILLARWGACH